MRIENVPVAHFQHRSTKRLCREYGRRIADASLRAGQQRTHFCLSKVCPLFIQAAGLVYHPPLGGISSKTVKPFFVSHHAIGVYKIFLRIDDIQGFALIYQPKYDIIIKKLKRCICKIEKFFKKQ